MRGLEPGLDFDEPSLQRVEAALLTLQLKMAEQVVPMLERWLRIALKDQVGASPRHDKQF